MQDLNVILLAGGSSSRFKPLKEKNLYKFLGKSLIEIQVEKLSSRGVSNLIVITNDDNFEEIKNESSKVNSEIKVIKQVGEGQAGAVNTALAEIESGDVLIVNMNDIFDDTLLTSFESMRDELKSSTSNMITGYKVDEYFPGGYLIFDENQNIVDVIEKPGEGNEPSDFVKLVFDYFADVNILKSEIEKAQSAKDDVYEVALSNMMKSGSTFKLLEYSDSWNTIKYPWHVLSMMEYFLGSIKGQNIDESAKISEGAIINGDVIIEEGVKIFDGAIINGPVYIGKNSIIGNHTLIRNSILGENCVVGGSEVARSYFGDNIELHRNYVGDSILESHISFGAGSRTANFRLDEGTIKVNVKGEKVDSNMRKLGSIIGSYVKVGVGSNLMPGIKIGTNSVVGPGIVIEEYVDDNTFVKGDFELEKKENKLDLSKL